MAKIDLSKLKLPRFGGRQKAVEPARVAAADDGGRRKKILMGAVGAVTVAIIGWLGWDAFMAEPPPSPPPPPPVAAKPKPPAEVPPEKLVDQLLENSGLAKQLAQIPDKVALGVRQSSARPKDAAAAAEVEKIMGEAFSAERFQQRVREALKKDFDRKRVESLNKTLAAPQMKKLIDLETKPLKGEEMAAFAKELGKTPLPPERVQVLNALADATRASEFAVEIVTGTTRAMMMGAVGGDAATMGKFDAAFDKQKAKLAQAVRDATVLGFAYTYRDVPDAELAEYARFYASEDGQWLMDRVMGAILEEARAGAGQAGVKLAEAAKARKGGAAAATATAKAPKPAASAAAEAPAAAPGAAPMLTARAKLDARECLKFDTNQAIHRCAERFR
jgi:hypothetical protein